MSYPRIFIRGAFAEMPLSDLSGPSVFNLNDRYVFEKEDLKRTYLLSRCGSIRNVERLFRMVKDGPGFTYSRNAGSVVVHAFNCGC